MTDSVPVLVIGALADGMDCLADWALVPGLPGFQFDNLFSLVHGVVAVVAAHCLVPPVVDFRPVGQKVLHTVHVQWFQSSS